jgi:hypothetical protein
MKRQLCMQLPLLVKSFGIALSGSLRQRDCRVNHEGLKALPIGRSVIRTLFPSVPMHILSERNAFLSCEEDQSLSKYVRNKKAGPNKKSLLFETFPRLFLHSPPSGPYRPGQRQKSRLDPRIET